METQVGNSAAAKHGKSTAEHTAVVCCWLASRTTMIAVYRPCYILPYIGQLWRNAPVQCRVDGPIFCQYQLL